MTKPIIARVMSISLLMAVVSLFIYIDSPGNVIFCQKRLDLNGKIFRLYNFRKFPARLKDDGPKVTVAADVRITRVGKILERTKLDELPQLWNIRTKSDSLPQ